MKTAYRRLRVSGGAAGGISWAAFSLLASVLAACAGCGGDDGATDARTDGDVPVEAEGGADAEPDAGDGDADVAEETVEDVPIDETGAVEDAPPPDEVPPRLVGALSLDVTRVRLVFDEPLADDADNGAYYEIFRSAATDRGLRVVDAVFGDTPDVLFLTTAEQENDVRYTVRVLREDTNTDTVVDAADDNLTDVAGNPIDPDHDRFEFTGISSMVYVVTDVMVSDGAVPPEYTGMRFNTCTEPYVPPDVGTRLDGEDVNRGIGGSSTTINVKFEHLATTSTREVVTDISAQNWPGWAVTCPSEPGWVRANGTSRGIAGALTTHTDSDCWCIGLCMRLAPLNEARATGFVSDIASSWNTSGALACPATCHSNEADWTMVADELDIHRGCGDDYYLHVCTNSATSGP